LREYANDRVGVSRHGVHGSFARVAAVTTPGAGVEMRRAGSTSRRSACSRREEQADNDLKECGADDHSEGEAKIDVRNVLAPAPGSGLWGEPDLEGQRSGDPKLDGDHGLEVLKGDVVHRTLSSSGHGHGDA
jgi:hypothetical protein